MPAFFFFGGSMFKLLKAVLTLSIFRDLDKLKVIKKEYLSLSKDVLWYSNNPPVYNRRVLRMKTLKDKYNNSKFIFMRKLK